LNFILFSSYNSMIDTKDLLNSRRIEYGTKSNLALYTKVDSNSFKTSGVAWKKTIFKNFSISCHF